MCFKGGKHVFNCCKDFEIFSKFGRFILKTVLSISCLISKVSNKSAIGKICSRRSEKAQVNFSNVKIGSFTKTGFIYRHYSASDDDGFTVKKLKFVLLNIISLPL